MKNKDLEGAIATRDAVIEDLKQQIIRLEETLDNARGLVRRAERRATLDRRIMHMLAAAIEVD